MTDASDLDSNGYGGHGIYLDNRRVWWMWRTIWSIAFPGFDRLLRRTAQPRPNEANIIKNNILAFARLAMVTDSSPYADVPSAQRQSSALSSPTIFFISTATPHPRRNFGAGRMLLQRRAFRSRSFRIGAAICIGAPTAAFASDAKAFHVQPNPGSGPDAPCSDRQRLLDVLYVLRDGSRRWERTSQSVVQNPGFNNPAYPADDYSLPKGSPGVGFVVFDPNQAGRSNPVIKPPAVPATFPTKTFNPATDY